MATAVLQPSSSDVGSCVELEQRFVPLRPIHASDLERHAGGMRIWQGRVAVSSAPELVELIDAPTPALLFHHNGEEYRVPLGDQAQWAYLRLAGLKASGEARDEVPLRFRRRKKLRSGKVSDILRIKRAGKKGDGLPIALCDAEVAQLEVNIEVEGAPWVLDQLLALRGDSITIRRRKPLVVLGGMTLAMDVFENVFWEGTDQLAVRFELEHSSRRTVSVGEIPESIRAALVELLPGVELLDVTRDGRYGLKVLEERRCAPLPT